MGSIRATVRNGRLIVDEPTRLPEGTTLDLVVEDKGDELTDDDRAALHAAITQSWEQLKAGEVVKADVVIEELRRKR